MKTGYVFGGLMLILGLAGCSVHSSMLIKNTVVVKNIAGNAYEPHNKRVFITHAHLPETAKYETLAKIDVGKATYGTYDYVYENMADSAREIGADAVVDVETWMQPGGWGWSTPHGRGVAVKITEAESVDLQNLSGYWK